MKITCDMAMDLAGLYKDGLASPDSVAAVEEHLKECPACRHYYETFRAPVQAPTVPEAVPAVCASLPSERKLEEISRRIRRRRMISHACTASMLIVGASSLTAGLVLFFYRKLENDKKK